MKTKKITLFLYYLFAASLACLFSQTILAAPNQQFFPMYPRIISQVVGSDIGIFNGDAMMPIYGNEDHILYIDGIGRYGTDTSRLGSLGIGTRNIFENTWLLGEYLFFDQNKTAHGSNFQVVNPGFEFMSQRWDLHINGYFPIHEKEFKGFNIASHLGNNNFLYFHQHAEFDKIFAIYDVIGKGGDIETGYSFPLKKDRIRVFAGGYFYTPPSVNKITGIQGGVEFPIREHMKLVLQDSYDNVFHNTASIALRFTLGGVQQTERHQLEEHILDPIPRHLGTLRTGSGILNQQQLSNTGRSLMVDNNLWFFQPGTGHEQTITENSCTFEKPCVGLTQTTINGINNISPNAKLYLAPGQYNNAAVGDGFTLNAGQSIFGRTQNYLQLAQGEQRALINDTLFLNGNNIVSNLQVNGQSDTENLGKNASRAGIIINNSAIGTIQINNSNITTITTDANYDAVGILNSSLNATVELRNSTATAFASGTDSMGVGVYNRGKLTIFNSILSGNVTATNAVGIGIFNEDFGQINILNSNITANATTLANGIFNEDFGRINILNSNITANATTLANGIFNEDFGQINILNSNIAANATTLANGIFNEDFGRINILNSTIFANSATLANGIFNEDFGRINILNSIIIPNLIDRQNWARSL